ncbi:MULTISPECIES: NnrS family protein [Bradyrhizobium]|uniref:NnrS family protein n=1 Tax=Bradyrhizobium TaxID=374 RepID=UPI00155F06EA|nr:MULTISPECIES: NnrS family protein [Bradyrhizobium]MDD1517222.1 short-chain dehydrogenase [Bradyrhizobium sp. WBAH30]MDD1541531.1 short-chain dehydrogenase [Bradyrhizobium sp. WBAH41]MDD1555603.1 short-chain dehydrogenase [Bradyrhizobium sp. WBAH23]MDD1564434.1 short-chain dehydrogenase [Bradyrhizobium sp. WBAH33]MDD1593612.1 short-chain dehydrogenase [Bradyrhizobium sp. WBAH42]
MAGARSRNFAGWPLFANSFRPFFLLAAIQASLSILAWLPMFYGELSVSSAFAPRDWHIHEMLYGFLPAVITGFLFTAIPNWTGRLPIQGGPLAALLTVWLAGRVVVTLSANTGWAFALVVDAAFLALVVAAATREIIAGGNWRNLPVVGLVLVLLAGNVAFHVETHYEGAADVSIRVGIGVVILLIGLIGGRIIPSFTRNWLVKFNPGRLPVPFGRFDGAVIGLSALALIAWIVAPLNMIAGVAMAVVGVLHLVRLARWAGDRTTRERLLLILHVGYVFVPLGFILNAVAALGELPPSAGIHAWMAGAAGTMTLAMMTRASLGHTGQALTASPAIQGIYAAIIIAALARVGAVVSPAYNDVLLHIAACGWIIAFLGFAVAFGPLLAGSGRRALATMGVPAPAR